MKHKKSPTARTEKFTIVLSAAQARRLRFIAEEIGQTPESVIADASVDQVGAYLEDGAIMDHESRDAEREVAGKLNSRRRAA